MESSIVADDVFETVGRRKEREREGEREAEDHRVPFLSSNPFIHPLSPRSSVIDSKFGGKN